jgi:hypothetical protein
MVSCLSELDNAGEVPDALRRPQAKNKVCSDKEFTDAVLGDQVRNFTSIIELAQAQLTMSPATAKRYLSRLKEVGVICSSGGLYWVKKQQVVENKPADGSMAHIPIKE